MGLTHSFAADENEAAPARTFSARALPDDDTLILRKKPRTDALAALKCGADDDLAGINPRALRRLFERHWQLRSASVVQARCRPPALARPRAAASAATTVP